MFTTLDEMVNLTNIGTLFAFILICIGIMILRFREPNRERPFRVPFGPVLPTLGIVSSLGLIYYLPPSSWWRFVGWLGVGAVIYLLYGYGHSRLRNPRPPAPRPSDFNPAADLPPTEF
jgi:APA family basic amino acid/polyamine antiporter